MTVLALTAESVRSPTRLDLAVVENMMIWPDDETARDEAMRTATVQFGRDMWNEKRLPVDLVGDLLSEAVIAAKPIDLIEVAKDRVVDGFVVGTILYRAIAYRESEPDRAAIGANVKALSARLFPSWPRKRPGTIHNKILPRFRPVAHFWASLVTTTLVGLRDGKPPVPFPCRRADLPMFLAIAEEFRIRGETCRLPHAPTTIIVAGTSVMLPSGIELPPVVFELP